MKSFLNFNFFDYLLNSISFNYFFLLIIIYKAQVSCYILKDLFLDIFYNVLINVFKKIHTLFLNSLQVENPFCHQVHSHNKNLFFFKEMRTYFRINLKYLPFLKLL